MKLYDFNNISLTMIATLTFFTPRKQNIQDIFKAWISLITDYLTNLIFLNKNLNMKDVSI